MVDLNVTYEDMESLNTSLWTLKHKLRDHAGLQGDSMFLPSTMKD